MLNIHDIDERLRAVETIVLPRGAHDPITELSENVTKSFNQLSKAIGELRDNMATKADIAELKALLKKA